MNKIENVGYIIAELKAIRSKNSKLAFLRAHRNIPGLKDFFKLCLCPSLNYYHTKLPKIKGVIHTGPVVDTIYRLYQAGTASKPSDSLSMLQAITAYGTQADKWFATCVLARKPDCGIDTAVNKVWPGLIREQIYQGAIADNIEKTKKLFAKGEVLVEVKEDGCHMITEKIHGEVGVKMYSRQGEQFIQPPDFAVHCELLLQGSLLSTDYYIAGEGLLLDPDSHTGFMDRAQGNALINDGIYSAGFRYRVWDILDHESLIESVVCQPLRERRRELKLLLAEYRFQCRLRDMTPMFSLSIGRYFDDYAAAMRYKEAGIEMGCEGVLFKDPTSKFKNGKHSHIIKGTFSMDVDARVIDTTVHKQKPWQVGAYICEIPAGINNKIQFKVGSGLTEALRTEARDSAIGRVVTVTIKDLSRAKTKNAITSVTNPRLGECRSVFQEADCSDDVFDRYEQRTGRKHKLDVRN